MGNLSINNGGVATNKGSMPSIDLRYGPYASVHAAHTALSDDDVVTVGLTVGIIDGSNIVEYWYQGGTAETNLVPKHQSSGSSFSGSYNDLNNKPTISDGGQDSTQIPLSGNVKVTATAAASGQTTGVAVTAENGEITMAFTLEKGTDGQNGATPTINQSTKRWEINGSDTGVSAEGHNPNRGTYNVGDTFPSDGVAGDYIVVVYNSQSTPTAEILKWDTTQSDWSQTGMSPNDAVFEDGQLLPNTKIDDTELASPAKNALAKAVDVKGLKEDLYGRTTENVEDVALSDSDGSLFTVYRSSQITDAGTWVRNNGVSGDIVVRLSVYGKKKIAVTAQASSQIYTNRNVLFTKKPLPSDQADFETLIDGDYLSSIYETASDIQSYGKGTSEIVTEFDVPEDAVFVYVTFKRVGYKQANTISLFTEEITGGDINRLNALANEVSDMGTTVETLGETVVEHTGVLKEIEQVVSLISTKIETTLTVNDFTNTNSYISSSGTTWQKSSMSYAGKYIKIKKDDHFKITGKTISAYTSRIALVAGIGAEGTPISFFAINDESKQLNIPEGTTVEFTVGQDCYLWVYAYPTSSNNVFPTEITKTVIEIKGVEDGEVTRANVNLVDETRMTSGVIDTTNGEVVNGSGRVTDYLNINLGNNSSYQKTQFVHACSISNETFGWNATSVAVYDATKSFIGMVDSSLLSSCIDKEGLYDGIDNAELFTAAAKYVRVQFPSGNESYYVCNANDRLLPEYSKYNEADLYQTREFIADKIHNSDGAITKMLMAALTYVGVDNGLGYGDSNTAFDQFVDAVVADSWTTPARYTGTRKQINCSAFVQLALQGIGYGNSRYALGSNRRNIITNYRFDSKTTYNFRNPYAANGANTDGGNNPIYCSDYGKLYANTMAKYAEDRGFLFKIAPDLSNLEVGDVLFHVRGNPATYRGIGHVSFVCNVRENIDGSKTVERMEVTGSIDPNLAQKNNGISDAVWVARFPLPQSDMRLDVIPITRFYNRTEVVDDDNNVETPPITQYYNDAVADVATTETLLSILTLAKNLGKRRVYTLVGKLSNNPEGKIQPIVKVSGTTFDGDSTDIVQRPDGWFVKHIILAENTSVSSLGDVKIYVKASETLQGVNLQLVDVKLYEGYVTL